MQEGTGPSPARPSSALRRTPWWLRWGSSIGGAAAVSWALAALLNASPTTPSPAAGPPAEGRSPDPAAARREGDAFSRASQRDALRAGGRWGGRESGEPWEHWEGDDDDEGEDEDDDRGRAWWEAGGWNGAYGAPPPGGSAAGGGPSTGSGPAQPGPADRRAPDARTRAS